MAGTPGGDAADAAEAGAIGDVAVLEFGNVETVLKCGNRGSRAERRFSRSSQRRRARVSVACTSGDAGVDAGGGVCSPLSPLVEAAARVAGSCPVAGARAAVGVCARDGGE